MKKTILLLLASVSCVLVSACYSTPEMDQNEYKLSYEESVSVCDAQSDYQHEGLRNCIEQTIAYEEADKKTVTIIPTEKGTLVIPKTYDDEDMMDTSRVYEVVGGKSANIVIEDGTSPDTSAAQTAEVTEENENAEEEREETAEDEQENIAEDEGTEEVIVIDEIVPEEDSVASSKTVVSVETVTQTTSSVEKGKNVSKTVKTIPTYKKNEKEVLPTEEK